MTPNGVEEDRPRTETETKHTTYTAKTRPVGQADLYIKIVFLSNKWYLIIVVILQNRVIRIIS